MGRVLAVLCMLVVASTASAATMTTSITDSNFGEGRIGVTSAVTETITVTNDAAATSALTFSVTSDNGDFDVSSPGGTLAAGESMEITVTFTPSVRNLITGSITVAGNDTENPSDTFAVHGIGTEIVFAASPTSLDFGIVDVGQFADLPLTITNNGNVAGEISAIDSGDPSVTVTVIGDPLPRIVSPLGTVELTVRFTPADGSVVSTNLTITTDGTPATVTVPVTGDGLFEDVAVTVTGQTDLAIDLGNARVGVLVTKAVTVTNIGETTATVELPTSSTTACTVQASGVTTFPAVLAPLATATFDIRITPSSLGTGTCTITVTTDIPTTDMIVVDYVGVAPDVTLTLPATNALNFGAVDVDASPAMRTIVLANDGTAPLAIGPCTITGSARFSMITACTNLSVAPGSSATLAVRFDPMVEASESAELAIGVDALNTSQVTIALSGVGADQRLDLSALSVSFPDTAIAAAELPIEYIDVFNPTNPTTGVAETLHISMATTDDEVFVLANQGPFTVEPGAMIRLAITFDPQSARTYEGLLVVASDASASPMAEIALHGRGIEVIEQGGCCDSGRPASVPLGACVLLLACRRRRRR